MAVDGKHGVGRAPEVLGEYVQAGLDIIGLHETRRNCHISSWCIAVERAERCCSPSTPVVAHVRLLGRFSRIRPVRIDTKPHLNRRRLTMDPQLLDEVATAIGARLRALPSRDAKVDTRETASATATLQVAEALVPQQKRTTLGRG